MRKGAFQGFLAAHHGPWVSYAVHGLLGGFRPLDQRSDGRDWFRMISGLIKDILTRIWMWYGLIFILFSIGDTESCLKRRMKSQGEIFATKKVVQGFSKRENKGKRKKGRGRARISPVFFCSFFFLSTGLGFASERILYCTTFLYSFFIVEPWSCVAMDVGARRIEPRNPYVLLVLVFLFIFQALFFVSSMNFFGIPLRTTS